MELSYNDFSSDRLLYLANAIRINTVRMTKKMINDRFVFVDIDNTYFNHCRK